MSVLEGPPFGRASLTGTSKVRVTTARYASGSFTTGASLSGHCCRESRKGTDCASIYRRSVQEREWATE